jgi:hypothetical protein
MLAKSKLVTHHHLAGRPGVYSVEPVLSELEFTRRLTLDQRRIPEGDADVMDRVATYDATLLDEFFTTLPDRVEFWAAAREEAIAKKEALFGGNGETIGTSEIASYVNRLEWVARRGDDSEFLALNGHQRFHVVAIALRFGIDSARRFWHGSTEDWGDDEMDDVIHADRELEFLIYRQRGSVVEFRSESVPRSE